MFLEGQWERSYLECLWNQKPCTFNREELVWHPPEKFQDERPSKWQKVSESPLLGSALVLDTLTGLMEEVTKLQDMVHQRGELLIGLLEGILGRPKEERIYLKWESEE